jgi:hypothetical protein
MYMTEWKGIRIFAKDVSMWLHVALAMAIPMCNQILGKHATERRGRV